MRFIRDELMHRPEAKVGTTLDHASQQVPVYKWTADLKADILRKLGKSKIQSINPMLQLAKVRQDIWELALKLSQPSAESKAFKHKPLTLITTFHTLASLSDNQKLSLLTALYKGEIEISQMESRVRDLKVCKQIKAAFAADARMDIKECQSLLGDQVFETEIDCWTAAFIQCGKGKVNRPPQFTHWVHTLTKASGSHDPKVCLEAQVFHWESPTKFTVQSFLHTLGLKDNMLLVSFNSHTFAQSFLFWNKLAFYIILE